MLLKYLSLGNSDVSGPVVTIKALNGTATVTAMAILPHFIQKTKDGHYV